MRLTGLLLLGVMSSGCELLAGGGGGTGGGTGGGGGTMVTFTKGYVYVRKDDRNVYLVNETDLQTTSRLTTSGGTRHPSLSSDGKRVVFARQTGSDTEIAIVPTAGGNNTIVLSSSATVKNLRNPIFSRDMTQIFFAYDVGASSALGVVNLDGTGFKSLAGGSFSYASPSLFADGATMLAAAGSSSSSLLQLERVDAASGMATNVASTLGLEAQVIVNRVVVSPDGTRAAFDGRVSSGSSRIFVMNLSSKAVTKLTDYPADPNANDTFPTWVGNDKVGFSSDVGGNDQVYVLPATAMNTSGGLTLPSAVEPWYGP
jgi:TolB protein